MDHRTEVITNKNELDTIIDNVNDSPRRLIFKDREFDYLPHGMLIFENAMEKRKVGIIYPEGNSYRTLVYRN